MVVVGLALGAGWSLTARVHPLLPPLSAAALLLVVLVKVVVPPSVASAFPGATTGDPLRSKFAESFAEILRTGLGLHYAATWGIWLAAIGAGLALAGTIAGARR